MKKQIFYLLFISCVLQGCNKGITYTDQKENEKDDIQSWILKHDYKIISEEQFYKQDSLTNENEFVLLKESGVYMNIIQRGKGKRILDDGRYTIISRYLEIALSGIENFFVTGDTLSGNMKLKNYPVFGPENWSLPKYMTQPDDYILTIDKNTYKASFKENSMMAYVYKTASVPSGWLIPLRFLKPANSIPTLPSEDIARVKLIVPHSQGSAQAMKYVYPCLYEITYQIW